jgi:hypothetical protein
MLPNVEIKKSDFNTGVVTPSDEGVLAIIAPSEKGDMNVAALYTRTRTAFDDLGAGPLVEFAAYDMAVAHKPVLLVRADPSTPGAYGTITVTGAPTGPSVITAGTSEPLDDYDVLVTFLDDGTVGTPGIQYTYSLDGGKHTSKALDLGTLTTLTIDGTGVSFDLAPGDVAADETVSVPATAPQLQSTDLADSLEALRVSASPWEVLLVVGDADDDMVNAIDLWLQDLETAGKYKFAIVNSRRRDRLTPETESEYATAMQAAFASVATINVTVAADGGDLTSIITGVSQSRPTSLAVAARAMATDVSVDPAQKSDGSVPGFSITDERANPKYHDEYLHPGLDDLRLATLRSFAGEPGVFITNAPILSPLNSDFVYLQHARVMNEIATVAYEALKTQLSKGVRKQRKAQPGGQVYIVEEDAQAIESLVQVAVDKAAKGRTSGVRFDLSRDDDIGSNAGATITGELSVAALSYIKQIKVTAKFERSV